MKRHLTVILPAIALSGCFEGCATGSTAGLSKDQIAARERNNAAWSEFGRKVAEVAINVGVGLLGANRGDQDDGFKK